MHLGEVDRLLDRGSGVVGLGLGDVGPRQFTLEALVHLAERPRDAHVDAGDERRLARVGFGDDDAADAGARERVDEREGSVHGTHAPVEPELAEDAEIVEDARGESLVGTGERDRDGELEPGAGLAHVGGREVDGDAPHGPVEVRREQRGAHALARLASGRVGESDDRVARQAARHVHLDRDDLSVDPTQRGAADEREHNASSRRRRRRPEWRVRR